MFLTKEGSSKGCVLRKLEYNYIFFIKLVYCFVHFSLVSMTTPRYRYLAESVSEMGVS